MTARSTRLIGVFNAEGTIRGELTYVARKLTGRGHCALCDVTHGWSPRGKPAFREVCERLPAELELVHLDERSHAVRAASDGRVPCVLVERDSRLELLLGPEELEACAGDPARFEAAVLAALAEHD